MPYRDQYDFCTPEGFEDEDFEYVFNFQNTPALAAPIAPGQTSLNIPLQLQTDSAFIARGLRIFSETLAPVQLREPGGKYLSPDLPPLYQSYFTFQAAGLMTVCFDDEIECPQGSVFLLYLTNPDLFPAPPPGFVEICGVKRYADCD